MKKYLKIFTTSLQEAFTYRLNFVMWRVRQIFVFLIPFYMWSAVLGPTVTLYGYQLPAIITYLFGTTILRSLVMGSRSIELGWVINSGELSMYLLKPMRIFMYWFSRDLSDKLYNLTFIVFEIPLLFLIFRPPVFIQTNLVDLGLAILAIALAVGIYFFLNLAFGCIAFWSRDVWAPRFLLMVILEFATGALFPLDMLPRVWQTVMELTPFPYLLFIPLKIYLGQDPQVALHLSVAAIWLILTYLLLKAIWKKGITEYAAEGN